jgi:phenylalanyl-tRNA synthetase beta chain
VVELANPMSGDQSQLRTTLLGSLLDVAARNRARGASSVRLFEAGAVYLPVDGQPLPLEPHHVGAILLGPARPPTWREPDPPQSDFFDAKGVLQGMLDALRIPWTVEPGQQLGFLHPGRAASIHSGSAQIGWLGELHPQVAAEWDLDRTVAAFELDLDAVAVPGTPVYDDVTSYPAVHEDLAVIVSEQTPAAEVVRVVRKAAAPLLRTAEVFDVYRDTDRIGAGNVSLALRLTYRAADRTLTDEEVSAKRAEITAALESELGGRVRAG